MTGRAAHCASILLLTEDSGKNGFAVVEALSKRLMRLVDPSCRTHRIDFEPAKDDARRLVNGNAWKGKRADRVRLQQTIATKVAEDGPPGFVFFHVDGDCAWSERKRARNPRALDACITEGVRAILGRHMHRHAPLDAEAIAARMTRLIVLVPHYSIEAWLYQNIAVAMRLCRRHHGGRHIEQFRTWEQNRSDIDELCNPKDVVCLSDKHNLELATEAYPAGAAVQAGTSFAHAADALRACEALCAALGASRS